MKRKFQILLIFSFAITILIAQTSGNDMIKSLSRSETQSNSIVDLVPEPQGGINVFYKYAGSYVVYTQMEKAAAISCKAFLMFVVETGASLSYIQALSGVSHCSACDKEAVHVLKALPEKLIRRKQNGQLARVYYILPTVFRSEDVSTLLLKEIISTNFSNARGNAFDARQHELTLRDFELCMKYRPGHKHAQYIKAARHFKLGQKAEACPTWKNLLGISIGDIEAEKLNEKNCTSK